MSADSALVRLCRILAVTVIVATRCIAGSVCTDENGLKHQLEFLGGYSPQSATLIGTTQNRRFVLVGIEYGYRCWNWQNAAISFTPTVLPAAILLQPAQYVQKYVDGNDTNQLSAPHAVYGFAALPIGFTFDLLRTHLVHPFVELAGGGIVSTEPIPVNTAGATAWNFVFDFGGGVQWRIADKRAIAFGYKFLHISNAYTTNTNPGVDNNVLYIGLVFHH
jgi:opacity protein-like surface antigen